MSSATLKRSERALPALPANAGLEADYRRQLQTLVREMAESMLLHLAAAWRRNTPAIGFAADDDPIAELKRALKKWGTAWTDKLDEASLRISLAFAKRHRRNLDTWFLKTLRDAGFTVRFNPTAGMKQAYKTVIAENVNLIRSIAPQFLKDVETHVWQSVMQGSNHAQLTRRIEKSYRLSHDRAALIARDQNAKAKAVMEEQRRSELGISEAIWQHSHAGKVPRPTHVAMHGQRYEIKRGMYDTDEGEYVWPGTLINCRCTSRAIIPALEARR